MARVVDVYSLPVGVLKTSTIQFDPSDDGCTLTPIACGVPPGPVIRPDTMTYNTAASTTVMATIRMVAITGDTAASSLLMTLFMAYFFLVAFAAMAGRGLLRRESIGGQYVALITSAYRSHVDVVARSE